MDPITGAALISGGTSLLGGILGSSGQASANRSNERIARETNQFNAAEAEKNRQFQERMSSTAKSREMQDLKNAGLNPLLAAKGSASTPGGATATGNMADMKNAMEPLAASAREIGQINFDRVMQGEQIKQMRLQNLKLATETKVMEKGIPESEAKNMIWNKLQEILSSTPENLKELRNQFKMGLPIKELYNERQRLRLNKP